MLFRSDLSFKNSQRGFANVLHSNKVFSKLTRLIFTIMWLAGRAGIDERKKERKRERGREGDRKG